MYRTILISTFCAIALLTDATAQFYRDVVQSDLPLAYWRLQETNGTTAASLGSLAGADGSLSGAYALGQPGPLTGDPSNRAISFTAGTFVTSAATGNSLFGGRIALTLELWIRPDANQPAQHYVEYGQGNSTFALEGGTLTPTFYVNNNAIGTLSLALGTYSHIVLQVDGANGRIFKDGVQVVATPFSGSVVGGGGAFFIGSRAGNQRFATASVDEVAVYDRALSPAEIQEHFAAAPTPEPGTAVILGAGTVALLARRRPRRA